MQATRRGWETMGLALLLAVCSVLFARPLLLVGTALLVAWLLAAQLAFVRALERTLDAVEIDCTLSRAVVSTADSLTVTLAATAPTGAPLDARIELPVPVAATAVRPSDRTIHLRAGMRRVATAFPVEWPIAGRFTFDAPRATFTDRHGLFEERLSLDSGPTVTVEPRTPRRVHVGEGGSRIAAAYGGHDAGTLGAGLDPAELREYVVGDAAHRIDWKATARLSAPYVREFEAEVDRVTNLVIDHPARMGAGSPGETPLEYLRHVALAFVEVARSRNDPLGFDAVGDAGLTASLPPQSSGRHYASVRRHLADLEPTVSDGEAARDAPVRSPAAARRTAARLADDSPFATTLRPYLTAMDPYVTRMTTRPLVGAASTLAVTSGTVWTLLFTDDSDPVAVREAVKLLRRGDDHVAVFLAPRVLYEPGGLADLEAAYDRYVAFEELRRDLAQLGRVSAFEVAPGDRIEALLASRRGLARGSTPR